MQNVKSQLLKRGPLQIRALMHASRYMLKKDVSLAPRDNGHAINDREFSLFSQNGEDGILDFIFSEVGYANRRFVEFGFSPAECNALRLVKCRQFSGLWIDGNEENCAIARSIAGILRWQGITVTNRFIHADNVNAIIQEWLAGNDRQIDLLSIDVDGVDYWILRNIDVVRPRVLVCEYNAIFGHERAITVPYSSSFNRFTYHADGLYFGASLKAFEKLADRTGYRLIGTDSSGNNAFFIDETISAPRLKTLSSAECWKPMQYWASRGFTMEEKFAQIAAFDFEEV